MSIEFSQGNGTHTVKITERLTIYEAEDFVAQLYPKLSAARAEAGKIELDLDRKTKLDTCGVQLVLWIYKWCEENSLRFSLFNPSESFLELVDLLQINQLIAASCRAKADE